MNYKKEMSPYFPRLTRAGADTSWPEKTLLRIVG